MSQKHRSVVDRKKKQKSKESLKTEIVTTSEIDATHTPDFTDLYNITNINELAELYSNQELYRSKKLNTKEAAFLAVFERNLANRANACRVIRISRPTSYDYEKTNPVFKECINEIKEEQLDTVESSLMRNIKGGDTIAMLFYLKTIGAKRGYSDKQEKEKAIDVIGFEYVEATEEDGKKHRGEL